MMFTEQDHLQGKDPIVPLIYKKLIKEVMKFGPVKVEPKKTSIHLVNRFAFAAVYTRKNYLHIDFHLTRPIKNKRIVKSEKVSANRYNLHVTAHSPTEVSEEILAWLKEAFDLKA